MSKLVKKMIKGKERPVCVIATKKEVGENLVNSKHLSQANDALQKSCEEAMADARSKHHKLESTYEELNKEREKVAAAKAEAAVWKLFPVS